MREPVVTTGINKRPRSVALAVTVPCFMVVFGTRVLYLASRL